MQEELEKVLNEEENITIEEIDENTSDENNGSAKDKKKEQKKEEKGK